MKKKMYNRPVVDCMIIELNEVLMVSGGGPAGLPKLDDPTPTFP